MGRLPRPATAGPLRFLERIDARMQDLPERGFADHPRPSATLACAFTSGELRAIRIGELDLRAIRARRQSVFSILHRGSANRLANEKLEALRALIIAAGSDFTGVALLDAYRTAVAAGIEELKLQALVDLYWCEEADAVSTGRRTSR